MYDPEQTPLITETLLKKRRSLEELAVVRSEVVQLKNNKKRRVVRGENVRIKRPEQFVKEARIREGSLKKVNRKKTQTEKTQAIIKKTNIENTVGFIVRIQEARNTNKLVKKELADLGLNEKFEGTFFKLDEEGLAKLKPLESYLVYGYITLKSVEELVHRRAHIIQDGLKKPLTDNITVENILGQYDILCLSDLSREIYNLGEHYNEAVSILSSFKLSSPIGTYEKKTLKVKNDELGFVGKNMDDYLSKIL